MKNLKTYVLMYLCLLAGLALQAQNATLLSSGLKPGAATGKNMIPANTSDGKLTKASTPVTKQTAQTTSVTGNKPGMSTGLKNTSAQNIPTATSAKPSTQRNAAVKASTLHSGNNQPAQKGKPIVPTTIK